MKRIVATIIALVFVLACPVNAFAQENQSVPAKAAKLESKYGILIEEEDVPMGLTLNHLNTLDKALENVTPEAVRAISGYYQKKNGSRLTFSYRYQNDIVSNEVFAGGFDDRRSLIELYLPYSASDRSLIAGDYPINIIHELGHALHLMYTDSYGYDKMKREWTALNGSAGYQGSNSLDNPNPRVFASAYGSMSYDEDVAEVIGHAFIRYQSGQGLKGYLTKDGSSTALGKKIAYVEKMLAFCFSGNDLVISNFRRCYSASSSVGYQNMKLSGEYLQYIGYPQPRYVLNGTMRNFGFQQEKAVWIRDIGGWCVRLTSGEYLIVFPGGYWFEAPASYVPPANA